MINEKNTKTEEKNAAAKASKAKASKDYNNRMKKNGWKKFGIYMVVDTMRQMHIIADSKDITLYQLIEDVMSDYIQNLKKPI